MLRRALIVFLALAIAVQSLPRALAWNNTGHMIVALIAYRRLNAAQKQQVAEILKSHPHYKSYLLEGKPDDVDAGEWAFLKAATWPDFVRPYDNKPAEITKYHHGPWHYVDLPFVAPKDKGTIDAKSLKPKEPNLLTVLPVCVAKFCRNGSTNEEKAIDLCWILHLVGDVHQPLHCVSMYSAENPAGDMGGNLLAIRSEGVPMRLHAYWDDLLGTCTTYPAIDQLTISITSSSVYDPDKMPEIKKHPTLASWAAESRAMAIALVYLDGHLKTACWRSWNNHQIAKDDIPELPPGYEANARQLACRRIALAGYRLADLLNQTLK